MIKNKLFCIVLLIITILISNFSFAVLANTSLLPNHQSITTEVVSHNNNLHMNHQSSDAYIDCEIYCNALAMSCTAGINNIAKILPSALSYPLTTKLYNNFAEALYSIDLIIDHKPPIFY